MLMLCTLFIRLKGYINHESRFNLCGLLNQQCTAYIMPVAGPERMATRSVVKLLTLSRHTGKQTALYLL